MICRARSGGVGSAVAFPIFEEGVGEACTTSSPLLTYQRRRHAVPALLRFIFILKSHDRVRNQLFLRVCNIRSLEFLPHLVVSVVLVMFWAERRSHDSFGFVIVGDGGSNASLIRRYTAPKIPLFYFPDLAGRLWCDFSCKQDGLPLCCVNRARDQESIIIRSKKPILRLPSVSSASNKRSLFENRKS